MADHVDEMVFEGAGGGASTELVGGSVAGTAGTASAEELKWPGTKPDAMIYVLRALHTQHPADCLKIAKTYGAWSTLSSKQKVKVFEVFDKLVPALKAACVTHALTKTNRMLDTEAATGGPEVGGVRVVPTTKDDLCRLLELRKDPAALPYWQQVESSLTRLQLDARHSTEAPTSSSSSSSMATDSNGFNPLAAIFNDWTSSNAFLPQNVMIRYHQVDGKAVPIVPYVSAAAETAVLCGFCHDINPSNPLRAHIRRDDSWVKDNYLKLRSALKVIFTDFERSGQMTDKSQAEAEWLSEEEVSIQMQIFYFLLCY
jgi:hypothetical protein